MILNTLPETQYLEKHCLTAAKWLMIGTDPDLIGKEVLSVFPPGDLKMKQLPDCLFEVECGTTDLFEMGRIFLEPNMQLEVPLGLYAKT